MRQEIYNELERIRMANDGVLDPKHVVKAAEDESNVLHSQFCWNDRKAAYEYRLEQARRLIRVVVTRIEPISEPVRVYVSLGEDRADGGYRTLIDVMNDSAMKEQLMGQARKDMMVFESKYSQIEALAKVIRAMEDVA